MTPHFLRQMRIIQNGSNATRVIAYRVFQPPFCTSTHSVHERTARGVYVNLECIPTSAFLFCRGNSLHLSAAMTAYVTLLEEAPGPLAPVTFKPRPVTSLSAQCVRKSVQQKIPISEQIILWSCSSCSTKDLPYVPHGQARPEVAGLSGHSSPAICHGK
jgi:hypothetical protein